MRRRRLISLSFGIVLQIRVNSNLHFLQTNLVLSFLFIQRVPGDCSKPAQTGHFSGEAPPRLYWDLNSSSSAFFLSFAMSEGSSASALTNSSRPSIFTSSLLHSKPWCHLRHHTSLSIRHHQRQLLDHRSIYPQCPVSSSPSSPPYLFSHSLNPVAVLYAELIIQSSSIFTTSFH